MKSVGIDIGVSSIKVAEIDSVGKGNQLSRVFEHKFNPDLMRDNDLNIIEFLKELCSHYDPGSTRYIFSLRQDQVSVRYKKFPFRERQKIQKSLPFELEEDIPFDQDDAIFDAKIVRYAGPLTEVLACACPREYIEKIVNLANDIGIDAHIISCEGLALANLREDWDIAPPVEDADFEDEEEEEEENTNTKSLKERASSKSRSPAHVILHIGLTRTLLAVYRNSTLVTSRSILWGGRHVVEDISKTYNIPYVEAFKEFETKAFLLTQTEGASSDQVGFSDTIARSLHPLVTELKLSFLDIQSEFQLEYQSIGLTGGASQIQNLGAFLTTQFEVPVNPLKYFKQLKNLQVLADSHLEPSAAVAVSLAIEGLKRPRNPAINFLRGEFARQSKAFKLFWQKWEPAIKIAATAMVILFIYSILRESFALDLAEKTTDALKTQAKTSAGLSRARSSPTRIRKFISTKKKIARAKKDLAKLSKMNSALDILNRIGKAMPSKSRSKIDIRRFSLKEDLLEIEGLAAKSDLNSVQTALKNFSKDKKLKSIPSSLKLEPGRGSFAYQFKVDRFAN